MAPPGYAPPPGYAYYPPAYDFERTKQIDRTKTGILLLMIGALLGWVPLGVSIIGGILSLIGAILVILGRKAFGPQHATSVIIAVVLFILGLAGLAVVAITFVVAIASSFVPGAGPPTAASLATAINTLLIGGIAVSVILGLAQVLFTYRIQDQIGRMLLFGGYGASVALQVAVFFLIAPLIAGAIAAALPGGTYNSAPILQLQNQINTYALLSVIPDLLWAGAYYLVWSRISRGELPQPPPGPSPALAPGYTPMAPPQAPPPSGPAPPTSPP